MGQWEEGEGHGWDPRPLSPLAAHRASGRCGSGTRVPKGCRQPESYLRRPTHRRDGRSRGPRRPCCQRQQGREVMRQERMYEQWRAASSGKGRTVSDSSRNSSCPVRPKPRGKHGQVPADECILASRSSLSTGNRSSAEQHFVPQIRVVERRWRRDVLP
jgi:hypothetical protein